MTTLNTVLKTKNPRFTVRRIIFCTSAEFTDYTGGFTTAPLVSNVLEATTVHTRTEMLAMLNLVDSSADAHPTFMGDSFFNSLNDDAVLATVETEKVVDGPMFRGYMIDYLKQFDDEPVTRTFNNIMPTRNAGFNAAVKTAVGLAGGFTFIAVKNVSTGTEYDLYCVADLTPPPPPA